MSKERVQKEAKEIIILLNQRVGKTATGEQTPILDLKLRKRGYEEPFEIMSSEVVMGQPTVIFKVGEQKSLGDLKIRFDFKDQDIRSIEKEELRPGVFQYTFITSLANSIENAESIAPSVAAVELPLNGKPTITRFPTLSSIPDRLHLDLENPLKLGQDSKVKVTTCYSHVGEGQNDLNSDTSTRREIYLTKEQLANPKSIKFMSEIPDGYEEDFKVEIIVEDEVTGSKAIRVISFDDVSAINQFNPMPRPVEAKQPEIVAVKPDPISVSKGNKADSEKNQSDEEKRLAEERIKVLQADFALRQHNADVENEVLFTPDKQKLLRFKKLTQKIYPDNQKVLSHIDLEFLAPKNLNKDSELVVTTSFVCPSIGGGGFRPDTSTRRTTNFPKGSIRSSEAIRLERTIFFNPSSRFVLMVEVLDKTTGLITKTHILSSEITKEKSSASTEPVPGSMSISEGTLTTRPGQNKLDELQLAFKAPADLDEKSELSVLVYLKDPKNNTVSRVTKRITKFQKGQLLGDNFFDIERLVIYDLANKKNSMQIVVEAEDLTSGKKYSANLPTSELKIKTIKARKKVRKKLQQ